MAQITIPPLRPARRATETEALPRRRGARVVRGRRHVRHRPRTFAVRTTDIRRREGYAWPTPADPPDPWVRAQPGIRAGPGILQGRAVAPGNEWAPPAQRARARGSVIPSAGATVSHWEYYVPVASASSRFTSQPSEEAGGSCVAGPMVRPSTIGGGEAMGWIGIASRGSPRPRSRRWWLWRCFPRRNTWSVGPDKAEPLSLEGLVFRTHT